MSDAKIRLATVWLDGCSGCHMSFLDIGRTAARARASTMDLVYSPLVDAKEFPEDVDVTLVEGAVSSEEDLKRCCARSAQRTQILVSLGDCAVTGNVPAMRNPFGADAVLKRAYLENATPATRRFRGQAMPRCWPRGAPVHEVVRWMCSCPAARLARTRSTSVLSELLAGRMPDLGSSRALRIGTQHMPQQPSSSTR